MECNCETCDPNWKSEYQTWKQSCDDWLKKCNLGKDAMMFVRTPDHLLRLPCMKERCQND